MSKPAITTEPDGTVTWVKRDGKVIGWYSNRESPLGVYASRDAWPTGTAETYKKGVAEAIAWIEGAS